MSWQEDKESSSPHRMRPPPTASAQSRSGASSPPLFRVEGKEIRAQYCLCRTVASHPHLFRVSGFFLGWGSMEEACGAMLEGGMFSCRFSGCRVCASGLQAWGIVSSAWVAGCVKFLATTFLRYSLYTLLTRFAFSKSRWSTGCTPAPRSARSRVQSLWLQV